jgi:transposase InsO family protein
VLTISERRACRALGQHRSTQRKAPRGQEDEAQLTADLIELARQYGRYGYRKIAALLRDAGWLVNDKRVERIWRREGLKVPPKQPKRSRLWLADGSCIRLRPEYPNHVWSYDFVEDRTHDGRKFRMLNVIDEFTHECLAIRVDRKLKATDVIDVLADLFISAKACQATSGLTMDRSSWPKQFRNGSPRLGPRRPTSNAGHPGRTGMWSRSMRG